MIKGIKFFEGQSNFFDCFLLNIASLYSLVYELCSQVLQPQYRPLIQLRTWLNFDWRDQKLKQLSSSRCVRRLKGKFNSPARCWQSMRVENGITSRPKPNPNKMKTFRVSGHLLFPSVFGPQLLQSWGLPFWGWISEKWRLKFLGQDFRHVCICVWCGCAMALIMWSTQKKVPQVKIVGRPLAIICGTRIL